MVSADKEQEMYFSFPTLIHIISLPYTWSYAVKVPIAVKGGKNKQQETTAF